jgi:hypothetical protein
MVNEEILISLKKSIPLIFLIGVLFVSFIALPTYNKIDFMLNNERVKSGIQSELDSRGYFATNVEFDESTYKWIATGNDVVYFHRLYYSNDGKLLDETQKRKNLAIYPFLTEDMMVTIN